MSYQPPQPRPSYSPSRRPGVRFEAIGESLRLLQAELGTWVSASAVNFLGALVVLTPLIILSFMDGFRGGQRHENPSLDFAFSLSMSICLGLLSAGLEWMGLKQSRGHRISLSDFYQPFRVARRMVPAFLLMALPGALLSFLGPVASMLYGIPSIILSVLLSMTHLLIMDRGMLAVDAMKLSWKRVSTDFWTMFALLLVSGLLTFLGVFGCGIGIIFTLPITAICTAIAYRDLFPEFEETSETPERTVSSAFDL